MGFGGTQSRPEVKENQEVYDIITGQSLGKKFTKGGRLTGIIGRILHNKGRIGIRDIATTAQTTTPATAASQAVMSASPEPMVAPVTEAPTVPPVVEAPINPAQDVANAIINDQLMAGSMEKRRQRFNRWGTRPW